MRKSLIFFSIIFFTNLYSTPILAQKNQNKKNNNSEIMVKIETTKGIITVKLYNETHFIEIILLN